MGDLSVNFSRKEFSCHCGCGFDVVDAELLGLLESVRNYFKVPVLVNSGCRCQAYNQTCHGAKSSQHLLGKAADIVLKGISPDDVALYLESLYEERYGIGRYSAFTHVDVRRNCSRWHG